MKTKEERLEICSTCTKRKSNPEKGLICSLTNEEPIFDDECPTFEADSDQLQKPKDNNTPQSISGWLTFFLWVGIGLGAIVTTKTAFNDIIIDGINWYFASAYATYIIALDIIAVYTIIAFYRRKSNAVALGITYTAMIALDGISSLILGAIFEDNSMFRPALRQISWGLIWFTYIQKSEDIDNLIPMLSRTWKSFEKIVLAIYIIGLSFYTASLAYIFIKTDDPPRYFFTTEKYIETNIEDMNMELPRVIYDGLTLEHIRKENMNIIFTYQYSYLVKTDFDFDYLDNEAMVNKHELLFDISTNPEPDPFAYYYATGHSTTCEYVDSLSKVLYTITITPEEYKAATEAPYQCPIETIKKLISETNKEPHDFFPNSRLFILDKILCNNNDTEMSYRIRLADLSAEEMAAIPPAKLTEFITSNWNDLCDHTMRLAVINQMVIQFDFFTASGDEYTTVRITPEIYNAY